MLKLVVLYSFLWICFHLGAGYVAHRLPIRSLVDLPLVGRTYDWERTGKVYRYLGIGWWKDYLPEAGAFYAGGFAKRRLDSNAANYLQRFADETSRAEWSHWLTWSLALTFFVWNPWQIGAVMVLYGAASNLPCILVQRYNRARLRRVLSRFARRAHRDGAAFPAHAIADPCEI